MSDADPSGTGPSSPGSRDSRPRRSGDGGRTAKPADAANDREGAKSRDATSSGGAERREAAKGRAGAQSRDAASSGGAKSRAGAKPRGATSRYGKPGDGKPRKGGASRGQHAGGSGSRAGGPRKAAVGRGSGEGERRIRETKPRPLIDEDVTGSELERPVLAELRTLPETLAKRVGQHLVMVGRLVDDNPQEALAHAQAARDLAPRVAILRETLGFAAYAAGDYAKAVQELRAARRISGNVDLLPMIADAERGLGRPDRALEVVASAPQRLPADTAVELLIVAAGARRDLGDAEAAVLTLKRQELHAAVGPQWLPRLRYAYADALRAAGRMEEARNWFALAAAADVEGDLDWPDEQVQEEAP